MIKMYSQCALHKSRLAACEHGTHAWCQHMPFAWLRPTAQNERGASLSACGLMQTAAFHLLALHSFRNITVDLQSAADRALPTLISAHDQGLIWWPTLVGTLQLRPPPAAYQFSKGAPMPLAGLLSDWASSAAISSALSRQPSAPAASTAC